MVKTSQSVSVADIIKSFTRKIQDASEKIKNVLYDTSSYRKANATVKADNTSIDITISGLEQPDENTTSPCDDVAFTIRMFENTIEHKSNKIKEIKYDEDSCKTAKTTVKATKTSIKITISGLTKAD